MSLEKALQELQREVHNTAAYLGTLTQSVEMLKKIAPLAEIVPTQHTSGAAAVVTAEVVTVRTKKTQRKSFIHIKGKTFDELAMYYLASEQSISGPQIAESLAAPYTRRPNTHKKVRAYVEAASLKALIRLEERGYANSSGKRDAYARRTFVLTAKGVEWFAVSDNQLAAEYATLCVTDALVEAAAKHGRH